MKEKTRNFYLKPSTEVFFVEYVQLMAGTTDVGGGAGNAGDDNGNNIIGGEGNNGEAKGFFGFDDNGNDFESEKIFSAETSWDD